MRLLVGLAAAAFLGCTAGAVGALFVPALAPLVIPFLATKAFLLLAVVLTALLGARRAWFSPTMAVLGLLAAALPVPSWGLAGLGALGLGAVGLWAAVRRKRTLWAVGLGATCLVGAARIGMDWFWVEGVRWFAAALGGTALAVVALRIFYYLSLARRPGVWATMTFYAAAVLAVLLPTLAPGTRFNVLMGLFILGFIVAAGVIASLFTYLFLKTFELLDSRFFHAYLYAVPLAGAPLYLVATGLRPYLPAGVLPFQWLVTTYILAADLVLGVLLVVLLVAGALGRRLGLRDFVAVVAWKFLRSQRAVPTPAARRQLQLRELAGHRALSGTIGRRVLEVAAGLCCLAGAHWLGAELLVSRTDVFLVHAIAGSAVGCFFIVRALQARGGATLWPLLWALFFGAAGFHGLRSASGFSTQSWSRFLPLVLGLLPLVVVFIQYLVRLALRLLGRAGRLSPALDPRLAPRIDTRIKEGVGASVFVSVVGVAVGVWALIVVLSVMAGFSGELEHRIIQTKDHVMIKASLDQREIPGALELAARVAQLEQVESASVYVEAEAMMSSSMNVSSTVTVRGIDRWGRGADFLEPSVVAGSLEFFRHPEDLVPFPGTMPYLQPPQPSPADGWSGDGGDSLLEWFGSEGLPEDPEPASGPGALSGVEGLAEPEDLFPEILPPPPAMPSPDGLFPMPPIDDEDREDSPAALPRGITEMVLAGQEVLPPVIIGQELAKSLGIGIGSKVTVISPDGDVGPMGVQPKARSYLVAAIFSTGMYEYDLKLAYMYLPDAQHFFNLGDGIDRIDVRLTNLSAAGAVRDAVGNLAGAEGLECQTWQEMNRNLFSALALERIVMFVVLGFIILIASFNIITSLIIIIRKRLAAVAILKTAGASAGEVTRLFFMLGSSAGLFGITSGIIMGLSSCGIIRHLGLTLPREYYIRSLPVQVDGWQVFQVAVAALLITALASLYPGKLAARISVVEGLKDER